MSTTILRPVYLATAVSRASSAPEKSPRGANPVQIKLTRPLRRSTESPESESLGGNAGTRTPRRRPLHTARGRWHLLASLRENFECTNGYTLYGSISERRDPWTILGRNRGFAATAQRVAAVWY